MEQKYKVVEKEVLDSHRVFPNYLRMECFVCGNSWGVRLNPGQCLTDKDLVCSRCVMNDYLKTI